MQKLRFTRCIILGTLVFMAANKKNNIGSKFDDFLKEEGIFEAVDAAAIKRVIAMKIQYLMTEKRIT